VLHVEQTGRVPGITRAYGLVNRAHAPPHLFRDDRYKLTRTHDFLTKRPSHTVGDAFYFGPERVSNRYTPERCDKEYPQFKDSTFAKVSKFRELLGLNRRFNLQVR
jgi:hypothetical protein